MRKLKIFGFLALLGVLIVACQKDKTSVFNPIDGINPDGHSNARSLSAFQDSFWVTPEKIKIKAIMEDMASKATVQEIGEYLDSYGDFKWENSRLVHEYDQQKYIVSIPAFKNDEMVSILFASVIDGAFSYWHFTLDEMALDMEILLQNNSAQSIALALLEIVVHGQNINSIPVFAYSQLSYQQLQDLILEVTPRGWCLKRYYLTQPEGLGENGDWRIEQTFTSDDSPNNGSYYLITNGYTSYPVIDGKVFINGEYLTLDEFAAKKKATIQGIIVGNVRIMWVWGFCPDEVGQDPWSFNWTTNTSTPPGSSSNDDGTDAPNWEYNEDRWHKDNEECLQAYGTGKDNDIKKLEDELLASACGEAARYSILNQVDLVMEVACAEFDAAMKDGEINPFPTPADVDDLENKITTLLSTNIFFEMGQKICKVCGDAYQCLADMDNCPLDGYENCVEEKLCNYAISSFENTYGLSLSQTDINGIAASISSCGENGFDGNALLYLFENSNLPDDELERLLTEYINLNFLDQNSPYSQANDCEKELMISHPDCASSLAFNWVTVNLATKWRMGINTQNECSDAYRHSFFNALNSATCGGVSLAREFGIAHECSSDSDKAKTMDLHNNDVGYSIIEDNPNILSKLQQNGNVQFFHEGINDLQNELCARLSAGDMKIFSDPTSQNPDNDPNVVLLPSNTCSCVN